MASSGRLGVTVSGVFYSHTPHFLLRREVDHPEATDERIAYALESPDVSDPPQGDRQVHWKQISEPGTESWWLKVVVVSNSTGPAILTAYNPDKVE